MSANQTTRLAVHGAAGRMGQRLVALAHSDPQLGVAQALEAEGHPQIGKDAGVIAGVAEIGVPLSSRLDPQGVDVVIDFSVPVAAVRILEACRHARMPIVVATTGFDESQQATIRNAAKDIPIVWAPNMSLAVNLAMKLCDTAAAALSGQASGVDVEIIERHHRFKEDAPSGTALKFGQIIAQRMGQSRQQHGRGPTRAWPKGEIGYHAVRAGDNPGEHTIIFGMLGETLEVRVAATSRDSYAQGVLAAAKWLVGKPPGLYGMNDVLGSELRILNSALRIPNMAKCDEGYLCDVCGRDVAEITESDLYLRYVIGMLDPEVLHTTPERHIRCNPSLAQYIVADDFDPVEVSGPFDKGHLDASFVAEREQLVTRGWRRLNEVARSGLPIIEYPLPEVVERIKQRSVGPA